MKIRAVLTSNAQCNLKKEGEGGGSTDRAQQVRWPHLFLSLLDGRPPLLEFLKGKSRPWLVFWHEKTLMCLYFTTRGAEGAGQFSFWGAACPRPSFLLPAVPTGGG